MCKALLIIPYPKQQILDSSKLKEFADDNFKFHEYSRKLIKLKKILWEKDTLHVMVHHQLCSSKKKSWRIRLRMFLMTRIGQLM